MNPILTRFPAWPTVLLACTSSGRHNHGLTFEPEGAHGYPPAFDAASLPEIGRHVPTGRRIALSEADALQFACNAVALNSRVMMNGASQELQARLRAAGLRPVVIPALGILEGRRHGEMLDAETSQGGLFSVGMRRTRDRVTAIGPVAAHGTRNPLIFR